MGNIILKILAGQQAGVEVMLEPGEYILGSGREDDLQLSDLSIAEKHLRLNLQENKIEIAAYKGDIHSENGINLEAGQTDWVEVVPLDIITIGVVKIALGARNAQWSTLSNALKPKEPEASNDATPSKPTLTSFENAKSWTGGQRKHVLVALLVTTAIVGGTITLLSSGNITPHTANALTTGNFEELTTEIYSLPFSESLDLRKDVDGQIYITGYVNAPVERRAIVEILERIGIPVKMRVLVLEALRTDITAYLKSRSSSVEFELSDKGKLKLTGSVLNVEEVNQIITDLRAVNGVAEVKSEIKTANDYLEGMRGLAKRALIDDTILLRLDGNILEVSGIIASQDLDRWSGFLRSYSRQYAPFIPMRSLVKLVQEDGKLVDLHASVDGVDVNTGAVVDEPETKVIELARAIKQQEAPTEDGTKPSLENSMVAITGSPTATKSDGTSAESSTTADKRADRLTKLENAIQSLLAAPKTSKHNSTMPSGIQNLPASFTNTPQSFDDMVPPQGSKAPPEQISSGTLSHVTSARPEPDNRTVLQSYSTASAPDRRVPPQQIVGGLLQQHIAGYETEGKSSAQIIPRPKSDALREIYSGAPILTSDGILSQYDKAAIPLPKGAALGEAYSGAIYQPSSTVHGQSNTGPALQTGNETYKVTTDGTRLPQGNHPMGQTYSNLPQQSYGQLLPQNMIDAQGVPYGQAPQLAGGTAQQLSSGISGHPNARMPLQVNDESPTPTANEKWLATNDLINVRASDALRSDPVRTKAAELVFHTWADVAGVDEAKEEEIRKKFLPMLIIPYNAGPACAQGLSIPISQITVTVFWLDILSGTEKLDLGTFSESQQRILLEAALNPRGTKECLQQVKRAIGFDLASYSNFVRETERNPDFVRFLTRNLLPASLTVSGVSLLNERYIQSEKNERYKIGQSTSNSSRLIAIGELGALIREYDGFSVALYKDSAAWIMGTVGEKL